MKNRRLVWAGIPATIAMSTMTVVAEGNAQTNGMTITLMLKENETAILWFSFGAADYQLVSAIVAMLVFVGIVWFVMGGKKR
ncbi:MAG: hypothetical protein KAH24_01120 [Holophagae bacterium]|nr:hypothetical protein [Holophagae bacterium]